MIARYARPAMAQVWAILALDETLRGVGAQVAELARQITLASRWR